MIKAMPTVANLLALILIPFSFCCAAQVVDISACRALEDRLQRFDCYESLDAADTTVPRQEAVSRESLPVEQSVPANTSTVAQPAEREQPAPVSNPLAGENRDVETFGRESEAENVRVIEGTGGKAELLDTIASLEQRNPNLWLITLQSGQTWRQMITKRYPMQVGDEVRIYPSRWGNAYRLTATRVSGYIQVERAD
jgi:hypothetical protein